MFLRRSLLVLLYAASNTRLRSCRVASYAPQVFNHSGGQVVGADKVRRTVGGAFLVAAADVAVLFPLLRLVPLLIHDAAAVRAKEHTREQAHFIIAVWAFCAACVTPARAPMSAGQ